MYVDVSKVLEGTATATLEKDKLLPKTGVFLLILLH